jgi:hypothetical protein
LKHWKCDDTIVIKITDWKWFKQTFYKIEFTKLTSCKIVGSEIVGDDIEKGVLIIEYMLLRTTNFWKLFYLTFYIELYKTRNGEMYIKTLTEMTYLWIIDS